MKNKIKRLTKRILPIVAVFFIVAMTVIPCFAYTVPVEQYKYYPTEVDDNSLIVTVTHTDDTDFMEDDVGGLKYQVLPVASLDKYSDTYNASHGVGDFEITYLTLGDDLFCARLYNRLKMGSFHYIKQINRTYLACGLPLNSDNYIEFRFHYDDEVYGDVIEFCEDLFNISIDIQYHVVGDEANIITSSYEFNDLEGAYTIKTSGIYSLIGVDESTPIILDYIKFNVYSDSYDLYTVNAVNFDLEIIYDSDTVFVENVSNENEESGTETDSDVVEGGENSDNGYEGIPDYLFRDFSTWIATAIGGFMNFEIVPYFSIGGLLSIIIAFTLVLWWLKLFGGG